MRIIHIYRSRLSPTLGSEFSVVAWTDTASLAGGGKAAAQHTHKRWWIEIGPIARFLGGWSLIGLAGAVWVRVGCSSATQKDIIYTTIQVCDDDPPLAG